MEQLHRTDGDNSLALDDFEPNLTEIHLDELRKERREITPDQPKSEIDYPCISPGDVIEVVSNSGEQYVHLIIQRRQQEYTTYRLDEFAEGRYRFFESHDDILQTCREQNVTIHHDPFNLRVSVANGHPLPALC